MAKPNPFAKTPAKGGKAAPAKGGKDAKPMPPWLQKKAPGMKAGGMKKGC